MTNYKTTITGALLAAFTAFQQGAFSDPTDWKKWIMPVGLAVLGFLAKDKDVTGGTRAALIAFACLMLGGCSTQQLVDARKGFLKSTDVSVGVEYGGVTVSDTITNGRRKVGVGVDGKELIKTLRQ